MGAAESAPEVLGVALGECFPLLWQVLDGKDGRDGTDRNAGATVDALDGIDVYHFLGLEFRVALLGVNTIHRTSIHTGMILDSDARFCGHISHNF